MKMKTKLTRILLLLALLILPTVGVHAQSKNGGDVVLFGQNYTLAEGETLDGSIAVFGGNIEIQKGAEVNGDIAIFGGNLSFAEETTTNGDVAVFGGNVTLSGEIKGDMVLFGGQALLESGSTVRNIATFGGQVTQKPGAIVTGEISNNTPPKVDTPVTPAQPNTPDINVNVNPLWNIFGKLGQAVLIAGIGMLLSLFLQPQLDRTATTIVRTPFIAGGYGLLVFIALPVALLAMVATIILIPVAAVVLLLIPLAWLFGIVALGQEVGERFTKAINQVWAPVLSTGFGTFLLMLVIGFVQLIPCVGWIPSVLAALVSVGAAVMTWFGTRNPPGQVPVSAVEQVSPAS
jgi:cytoskeletal protein CcmA (bactofilin family)